jgi:hypothetical protein
MATISIRVSDELQRNFDNTFQNSDADTKAEFLKMMLSRFLAPKEVKTEVQTIEAEPKIIEKNVIKEVERELAENEILFALNPVHLFALRETLLHDQYIKKTNDFIEHVNAGKDPYSIFTKANVFSGAYAGDIIKLGDNVEDEEVMKSNMAALLINVFMVAVIQEDFSWIGTPVTHKMLKAFKQELTEKSEPGNNAPWEAEN